jgi:hypothetical protein
VVRKRPRHPRPTARANPLRYGASSALRGGLTGDRDLGAASENGEAPASREGDEVVRDHTNRAHLRRFAHRASRVLAGVLLAAPIIAETTVGAHADFSAGFPGGCIVVVATVLGPNSCQFINVGNDAEHIVVNGGVATITAPAGCNVPAPSATTFNGTGGCTYTVALSGAGLASVADVSEGSWGHCAAATPCSYAALQTSGTAFGELVSTTPSSAITVMVVDNTPAIPVTVATCTASGVGSLTAECLFSETPLHGYTVSATINAGGGTLAVAAIG